MRLRSLVKHYKPGGPRRMALLPRRGPRIIQARDPWVQLPDKNRAYMCRKADPLPAPSPFWKAVDF